ncbi:MAG: multicomponent Na+:H+ antiporter subunit D, partial [Caulobacteraceae bacterium]
MSGALLFLWAHADAILVVVPMLAGVVLTILPAGRVALGVAIAVSTFAAALAAMLVVRLLAGAPVSSVDALGASAGVVIGSAAATAFIAFSALAPQDYPRRAQPIALGLGLVVTGAAFGAVIERDALRLALLLQVALLAGAALTGLSAARDRRAATAAFGGVIVALAGGALAVSGAALIYAATGVLDLGEVAAHAAAPGADRGVWLGGASLLAGLAAMAGLAPLHAD